MQDAPIQVFASFRHLRIVSTWMEISISFLIVIVEFSLQPHEYKFAL
jgi:hypothetical protein